MFKTQVEPRGACVVWYGVSLTYGRFPVTKLENGPTVCGIDVHEKPSVPLYPWSFTLIDMPLCQANG